MRTYIHTYIHTYIRTFIRMDACMYVLVYVCMNVCVHTFVEARAGNYTTTKQKYLYINVENPHNKKNTSTKHSKLEHTCYNKNHELQKKKIDYPREEPDALFVSKILALSHKTHNTHHPQYHRHYHKHTHTHKKTHNTHHPKYHRHYHKHTQKNKNKKQKNKRPDSAFVSKVLACACAARSAFHSPELYCPVYAPRNHKVLLHALSSVCSGIV